MKSSFFPIRGGNTTMMLLASVRQGSDQDVRYSWRRVTGSVPFPRGDTVLLPVFHTLSTAASVGARRDAHRLQPMGASLL